MFICVIHLSVIIIGTQTHSDLSVTCWQGWVIIYVIPMLPGYCQQYDSEKLDIFFYSIY